MTPDKPPIDTQKLPYTVKVLEHIEITYYLRSSLGVLPTIHGRGVDYRGFLLMVSRKVRVAVTRAACHVVDIDHKNGCRPV